MPLTRDALDQLLDTLHEQLAQRLAGGHDAPAELAAWIDHCVEVIRGFAAEGDRAHVEDRLRACLPLIPAAEGEREA